MARSRPPRTAGAGWTRAPPCSSTGLDASDDDALLARESALPGWTGRHLVAHVAANADALLNLVRWAATGGETPMYSSPEQRARRHRRRAPSVLPTSCAGGPPSRAGGWRDALDALSDDQWSSEVRTAQGRLLPATEIPWLRAREVMVHAVDLGSARGLRRPARGLRGRPHRRRRGEALGRRRPPGPRAARRGARSRGRWPASAAPCEVHGLGRRPRGVPHRSAPTAELALAAPELPAWL